jgi:ABC-2 type transport system ATP-binding protein
MHNSISKRLNTTFSFLYLIFMPIISVQEVSKKYGKKTVLDKLSLDINKGEIFGLLGSNGAGKSTVTKIILGLEKQTSGKISFYDGKKVDLRRKVALVPQETAFYKDFSVERNMKFFASINGLKGKLVQQRVDFLLNWLELTEFKKTKSTFLSGGYKRLLNIALSILHDPEIIFLDEPTVGLDPNMRKMFWAKINELKQAGKTIILTTHYMDEAETLCDRIALLKKGKLLTIGKPEDLVRTHGGIKVMVLDIAGGVKKEDLEKIKQALGQRNLITKGELLFVPFEQAHSLEKVFAIIQWLMSNGYNISSSTTKEPNLEDVFLNITGEKMVTE